MSTLFQVKNMTYNIRDVNALVSSNLKTVSYGKQSISYLAPVIWSQVPEEIKTCNSVNSFKNKIKQWVPDNCPCTLCKRYLPNIGYI